MADVKRVVTCGVVLVLAVCAVVLAPGCDEETASDVATVKIGGAYFHLEIASDDATRYRGLGGREYIAPDGGMLFVFPRTLALAFVMRDCPVEIDVAYLDAAGAVVAMYTMAAEAPRGENEPEFEYEARLKRYPSRFGAMYAIETAGGRLSAVGLKVGDRVKLDGERLKASLR